MENMERTISITLNAKYPVSYSGKVDVIIQDLNSGETRTIEVPMENLYTASGKNERVAEKIEEIGMEIYSWIDIMVDEMRFNEEEM